MRWRMISTGLILIAWFLFGMLYDTARGPIEGTAAVQQLQDNSATYVAARAVAVQQLLPRVIMWLALGGLIVIWGTLLLRLRNGRPAMGVIFVALFGVACGSPQLEVLEEIKPNETAFLVPLEGASKSGQGQFMSIEYLNANKVATKRVSIPTRQRTTGRGPGAYEWIPTVRVIKVDRTPVSRQWTMDPTTGTAKSNEALCVESRESIDFCVGVLAIAAIEEEDAAKFQYHYAGKPLVQVMDQDVRTFAGGILSREFGVRTLDQGRTQKADIFGKMETDTREFFKTRGVKILSMNGTEGLQYRDKNIQDGINATFRAEQDVKTAVNEKLAQDERNKRDVAKATAARQAAEEFAKAQQAQVAMLQLNIETMRAQAQLEAAKKWNGQVPQTILPQGAQMLFGLDAPSVKR